MHDHRALTQWAVGTESWLSGCGCWTSCSHTCTGLGFPSAALSGLRHGERSAGQEEKLHASNLNRRGIKQSGPRGERYQTVWSTWREVPNSLVHVERGFRQSGPRGERYLTVCSAWREVSNSLVHMERGTNQSGPRGERYQKGGPRGERYQTVWSTWREVSNSLVRMERGIKQSGPHGERYRTV